MVRPYTANADAKYPQPGNNDPIIKEKYFFLKRGGILLQSIKTWLICNFKLSISYGQ